MRAKFAEWDSKIFGRDVGLLPDWHPEWTVKDIREANTDFDVVFVKTHGWVDPPEATIAQDWLFDLEKEVDFSTENGVSRVEGPPPQGALAVAEAAFLESRFRRDPILASKAGPFYRQWLVEAEGRILVLDEAPSDAFLVEGRDPDGAGRIELVAVARGQRGRGLGTRLVHGAISRPGVPPTWRVRTSARNWKALHFYERLGFMVRGVSTAFHIWVNI